MFIKNNNHIISIKNDFMIKNKKIKTNELMILNNTKTNVLKSLSQPISRYKKIFFFFLD